MEMKWLKSIQVGLRKLSRNRRITETQKILPVKTEAFRDLNPGVVVPWGAATTSKSRIAGTGSSSSINTDTKNGEHRRTLLSATATATAGISTTAVDWALWKRR